MSVAFGPPLCVAFEPPTSTCPPTTELATIWFTIWARECGFLPLSVALCSRCPQREWRNCPQQRNSPPSKLAQRPVLIGTFPLLFAGNGHDCLPCQCVRLLASLACVFGTLRLPFSQLWGGSGKLGRAPSCTPQNNVVNRWDPMENGGQPEL